MRSTRLPVAAALLLLSTLRAQQGRVGSWESRAFRLVNRRSHIWYGPIWIFMQAGSLAAVWVCAGVAWLGRDRRSAARLALTGTVVWGGVKLVKPLVGRSRPAALLPGVRVRGRPQTGLGFPSGHAAVSTTLALLISWPSPFQRRAALAVAGLAGLARMYVGAHLPLDVVGGLAIGTLAGVGRRHVRVV